MYIKMCGRARQLRKLWEPVVGDFYYDRKLRKVETVLAVPFSRKDQTWLPRVDQLFYFALERFNTVKPQYRPAFVLNQFHQYVIDQTPTVCGSVEQLLLQFVMYTVHNQRYNKNMWSPCVAVDPRDPV